MEIERKFLVPENFRQLLEENGFGLVREFEEVLQDKYFDTHDHHLLHMVGIILIKSVAFFVFKQVFS